jgi:hypothetical protein
MLVNTSQQIKFYTDFFPEINPTSAMGTQLLGLLVNMFNIGSILSFFVTYVYHLAAFSGFAMLISHAAHMSLITMAERPPSSSDVSSWFWAVA